MKKTTAILLFCLAASTSLHSQQANITAEIDSLLTLASAAQKAGALKEAYDFASVAKEKCALSIGKETPQYAMSLHTMGVYLLNSGQLDKALPATLEALEIRRKLFGNQHSDYGKTLNNIVLIYFDLGLSAKAKPLAEESLALKEKEYGTDKPEITPALINLAKAMYGVNEFQKSNELLLRALAIREKQYGHDHPKSLSVLQLLGANYILLNDGVNAVEYNERAVTIMEKTPQGRPPQTLPMLMGNLGKAFAVNHEYKKELALQPRIDSLLDLAVPRTNHVLWALRYAAWMEAYHHNGMIKEAVEMALKTQEKNALQTMDKAIWMSGEDLFEQFQASNQIVHMVFSLATDYANDYPDFAQSCYNDALLYKGLGLSSQRFFERELSLQNTTATKDIRDWKNLRKTLSEAYSNSSIPDHELASLKNQATLLETRLMGQVGGFSAMRQAPTWRDVQAALHPGEAAIEFLRINYFETYDWTSDKIRYIALVLRPGDLAPKLIPLCFEKDLLPLLPPDSLRNEETLGDLYFNRKKRNGKALSDLIWLPMASSLSGVNTIYFSPAGLLNRLNLSAMSPDGNEPLADKRRFRQMLSTHTLAKPIKSAEVADALLLGGIRYDADSSEVKASLDFMRSSGGVGSNGNRGDENRGKGYWRYLRGSEKEVDDIQKTMLQSGLRTVQKHKGAMAMEELFLPFLQRPAPSIVHIATHGFSLPSLQELSAEQAVNAPVNAFSNAKNTMNRTGIILAGGNHAWLKGQAYSGLQDGILTAYEISQLDFSKTELVVLSACESGLGDIRGIEGVIGLQRAFKIAGAHYLILSLWQVPDQETQELMSLFYKKWLTGNMTVPVAFHSAQSEMRKLYPNPYYWAGFVLVE